MTSRDTRRESWDTMVAIGLVARPHGLRGEVVVNPETDFPEQRFSPGGVVYAQRGEGVVALPIEAVRFHKGRPIVKFGGVDDIDVAESLATCELRVPASAQQALPDDQFYVHALVGCSVRTVAGVRVGSVVDVQGVPGAHRLIVRRVDTEDEVDIPLADSICVNVDVHRKVVVISPPDGLLELNG